MLKLWRSRPYLVSAFLLASALTLFFAVRLLSQAIYWADPAHREQAVEGWMTVGYIARSWDLYGPDIDALAKLPLPDVKGHAQPLVEIAKDRGIPVADVIAEVEKAIRTLQLRELRFLRWLQPPLLDFQRFLPQQRPVRFQLRELQLRQVWLRCCHRDGFSWQLLLCRHSGCRFR